MSDGYQSIGVGSASRISGIPAKPPRALIAQNRSDYREGCAGVHRVYGGKKWLRSLESALSGIHGLSRDAILTSPCSCWKVWRVCLQLDDNERTYLFLLALKQPPPVETFSPPTISPTLQLFLDQLGTTPACAVDARLNFVARNRALSAVFGIHAGQSERDRNIIWRVFTQPGPKGPHWEEFARMCLAQFRAEYGRFIGDPWWAKQIAELSAVSPEFRELWARPDVLSALEGRKSIYHPRVGDLSFEFLWLQMVNLPDLRLFVYTPRSKETADKIAQLMAIKSET